MIPLTTRVIGEDFEETEDTNGEDAKGVEDSKGVEDAEPGKDLFGLEIVELSAGPAHKKGMKVGDIILAINGRATPDTESLQSVLQEAGSQAEVDFINVDNGELERIILRPMSGRIGAAVKQVKVE